MIDIMDLRAGNYIHPCREDDPTQPDTGRYLRVLSLQLVEKQVMARADRDNTGLAYTAAEIFPCSLERLTQMIGGLAFGEHSLLIQAPGAIAIVHENGSVIPLPHVQYLHQFQNLFRSLTAQEFPYNIGRAAE
ncbi:hypothetical protein [Taibaiella helva]|uniref:hypothetical protein n=1 Tax=Taibaiella helva TaxID=2301235 RepID=UPI001300AFAA|nr:hypothetical protein [Taibaiella helva]